MASKVEICNLVLTDLAAARLPSLDETTVEAKDCNAIYDIVAEQVMSMGQWPSTICRASLAQSVTGPEYQYTYAYQLPTSPKCLRVISVNDFKPGEIPYAIEGTQLYTDESTIKIKYIGLVTNTEAYDIYLQQAIVDHLTARLAYKITGQRSAAMQAKEYARAHTRELLSDASMGNGSSQYVNSDDFIDGRFGSWPEEGRNTD